jgi:hypothetical protein
MPDRRRRMKALDSRRSAWLAFGVAAVISAAVTLWLTRGTTFWLDEVTFFTGDRGFDVRYLLTPHNGQLILGPRLVYATIFKLFGPDYLVFRLVLVAGLIAVAGLVFALMRRRTHGAIALTAALVLLFFGSASGITVTALGIVNTYCVAAGLAAMLALERGGRFADPLAAILLVVSLSFWSPGLAFAIGALVLILGSPGWKRRLWVVGVPIGLYVLWWVTKPGYDDPFYGSLGLDLANVLLIPTFAADSLGSIMAALTGVDYSFGGPPGGAFGPTPDYVWGAVLATAAVAGLALALRRLPPRRWPWAWMAVLLALWASLALATGAFRGPTTDRYVYVGAAVVCVLAAAALSGIRLSGRVLALVLGVACLALGANIAMLRDASDFQRSYADGLRADLAALELARAHVAPDFTPTVGTISNPLLVPATRPSAYFPVADRIGSFADTLPELRAASEDARQAADEIEAQALGLGLKPLPGPPGDVRCLTVRPVGSTGPTFRLPAGGAVVGSTSPHPSAVTLRRFADDFTTGVGTLAAGSYARLDIPRDAAPDAWWARVGSHDPVRVCA